MRKQRVMGAGALLWLLLVGAAMFSGAAWAGAPSSQATLPAAYAARFNQAVTLLDDYRGDTSELEAAARNLDEILRQYPRYAPAYREKARYFIMRGHLSYLEFRPGSLQAADAAIKQALEINPKFAEAFVLRGHLYRLMNRHLEAIRALETAQKLGTKDPWLQNNWAALLADEGKYEAAAGLYREVVDSKTANGKAKGAAFEGLIDYYIKAGKPDAADETYRKQIAFEPGSAWTYGNYAQFLLCVRDDYEGAITRARQARAIMDYGNARYWHAAALYRKWAQLSVGRVGDQGKAFYDQARSLYPDPEAVAADWESCPPLRILSVALARGK